MPTPTKHLRNIASLRTLGIIIDALQFSNGRFYYNKTGDFVISSGEQEIIKAEFCRLLKDKRRDFLKDGKKDDSTQYQLSILKGRYDKLHRGKDAGKFSNQELINYYFPDDCTELYNKINEITSSGNRSIYDLIFKSIKRDAIHLTRSTIGNFKLFEQYGYAKLFNCEKMYNKLLRDFQVQPKLPRRKSSRRKSTLSRQNTPNASHMDSMARELTAEYKGRSRRSKKTSDPTLLRHTTLGKKRKSIGKGKSRTKRKSTLI